MDKKVRAEASVMALVDLNWYALPLETRKELEKVAYQRAATTIAHAADSWAFNLAGTKVPGLTGVKTLETFARVIRHAVSYETLMQEIDEIDISPIDITKLSLRH